MGTLLDWFRTRREANIIKGTRLHAKKVYNVVFELDNVTKLICKGKTKETPHLIKKISELENEADEIRRKIMMDLSKGELTPGVREDLAHLIKRLDGIANNANGTARRLILLTSDVLSPICEDLIKMSKITLECVKVLHKTIAMQLGGSSPKIFKSIVKINKLEHDVDVINLSIKRKLLQLETNYSEYVAITIYEMLNFFENISDSAEETAEFIRIINVR